MEPQIRSGDYVTFERVPESFTWRNVKDGAIYALADSDGTRVKRLGKMYDGLIIHSDNPAYPDEIFKGEDLNRIKIIGLAIERSGGIS